MVHKLGAHLSIAGGYTNALEKTIVIGGTSLQIFSSSPRDWKIPNLTKQQINDFVQMKQKLHIDPIYFHASYLINLADAGRIGNMSKQSLIAELSVAPELHIKGSIVHLGSFKNTEESNTNRSYDTLIENLKEVLTATPHESLLIIENAGNRKIGQSLEEIGSIVKDLNNERVRVCLDTCHLHGAGYDISTREKLDNFLHDFDRKIGLEKLEVFQVNDSKDALGSFRDRHENIGEGTIGLETFGLLLNHLQTRTKPFIIETPGFDKKGPDKQNLDILKSLIA